MNGRRPVAMPSLCRSRSETPLARHALRLQSEEVVWAPRMLFPMYTLPLEDVLQMSSLVPHETLKSEGRLRQFEKRMGKAVFVSHQWAGKDHPDPTLEQFSVFQGAMKRILSELPQIPLESITELTVSQARALPTHEFRSAQLFVWYDYFSCPQLENKGPLSQQAQAIASIHAYVAECSFFFALCPFIFDPLTRPKPLDASSWRQRGWCCLERTMRELGTEGDGWVLVQSVMHIEVVVATDAFYRPVGEGDFAVPEDKAKLGPVLAAALKRKMLKALKDEDFVTYRIVRNLQSVHLQGVDVEPELDLVPGFVASGDESAARVAEFFHQNGFSRIDEVDEAGFLPLHYAALNGDPKLVKALVKERADVCKTTRKGQPLLDAPPWISALGLSIAFGHNEVARLLIAAKAQVRERGLVPALTLAAGTNNVEGVRLLCAAGCDPRDANIMGVPPLETASWANSLPVLEELLGREQRCSLSKVLHAAANSKQGGAEAARRLLEAKADIDEQYQVPWSMGGMLYFLGSLRYRLGKITSATRRYYHLHGATPLMMAILSANFETAWILVSSGARVDLRNARNCSAADLAREVGVPKILQEALTGEVVFQRV